MLVLDIWVCDDIVHHNQGRSPAFGQEAERQRGSTESPNVPFRDTIAITGTPVTRPHPLKAVLLPNSSTAGKGHTDTLGLNYRRCPELSAAQKELRSNCHAKHQVHFHEALI